MTTPSYTEDLTDIATGDEASGWTEFGSPFNTQGAPAYEDNEYPYIQGNYAVTQDCTKTGLGSLGYDYGSTISLTTDGAFFVWQNFSSPFVLDDYAGTTSGYAGVMIIVGNDTSNFSYWDVGGSDVFPNPYGGFDCGVVNTTVTAAGSVGTKTIDRYVGGAVYVTSGPGKGEPHQVDVMRFGRGSAIFQYGEVGDYCTIAGFAAQNDLQANRWGLIQEFPGGYLWQGRMQLGTSSNACYFTDSNVTVFIKYTPQVTSNFNTVEVSNASSEINMTAFNFICLDPSGTASKGRWITTNDATVNLLNCSFQDMATFTFDSNTTVDTCTFLRCGQIDPGAGDLSFSSVRQSTVTGGGSAGGGALLWNDSSDPNTQLNDMTFTIGAGSHHAIEFGTSAPQTINLTNMTFTGFSASNQQTTSVLYFPDTGSDVTWTVNHTGTSGTISYYKARTGDTVTISSSVPITITVKDTDGNLISGVQTAVYLTTDTTYTSPIMNEDTVAGVASENYTGSTPVDVVVRCRKASGGDTKYKNYSSTQAIGTGGLTLTVTITEDPNNNATT